MLRLSTQEDRVYELIRNKIVELELKPHQPVKELALSKELGVSRTPVRVALARLKDKGFLVEENGYLVVPGGSVEDAKRTLEAREAIEVMCSRLAAEHVHERRDDLVALEQEVRRYQGFLRMGEVDPKEALRADVAFHEVIYRMAGNPLLTEWARDARLLTWRYRNLSTTRPERLAATAEEHYQVFLAIKDGDPEEAARRMRDHMVQVRNQVIHLLERYTVPVYGRTF